MLISLLRREPGWWQLRTIVFLDLMFAVFAASMAIGLSRVGSAQRGHFLMSFCLLSFGGGAFLVSLPFTQPWRQGDLLCGLPVPLRTQWLAQTVALTLSGLLPLALMSALIELGSAWLGSAWVPREWLVLVRRDLVALAAGWLLVVALLQGLAGGHPASRWATWGRARSFVASLTLLASAVAVLVACLAWPWLPWVAAVCGVAILWGSAAHMPEAADLVAPVRAAAVEVAPPSRGTRPGAVRRCLRRLTVTGWPAAVSWVLLLWGFSTGLSFESHDGLGQMANVNIVIFLVLVTLQTARSVLRMGLALPLSRRRLFAWTVLPPVSATALGLTLGGALVTGVSAARGASGERVAVAYRSDAPGKWVVEVPIRCWRLAWRRPPVVQTEVGAVRPRAFPLLGEGWPLVGYHPYDAGAEPNAPLLAAQMSRAAHDVLGISIPSRELERRYLAQCTDSGVFVDTHMLIRDYGRVRDTSPTWRVAWTSLALAWFLSLFVAIGPHVAQLSPRGSRLRKVDWQVGGRLLALAAPMIGVWLGLIWREEATSGLVGELVHLVEVCVPAHPLLAAPVLGALFAGGFFFHERRFAQMDMPAALLATPLLGSRL